MGVVNRKFFSRTSRALPFYTQPPLSVNPGYAPEDPGQLVSKPFNTWAKLTTKAKTHAKNEYHLAAMAKMKEFIDRYENPTQAVDVMLQSRMQRIMERNQHVMESLLKIVLLCGRQGLAFRGHRDD